MDNSDKKLSILLPAFNEESRIINTINETKKFVASLGIPFEIIVVDDGSSDNTFAAAQSVADNTVKVFRSLKNAGKGHALKKAFGHASGDLILFLDADLDIHPNQIAPLMKRWKEQNAQVVIGSKQHPDAKISYPLKRKILSFGFSTIAKVLFHLSIRDTQTGIKLFESRVLKEVFHKVQMNGYAFDLELLSLIAQKGYIIAEVPICVSFGNKKNHMTPKVITKMFTDMVSLFVRLHCRAEK